MCLLQKSCCGRLANAQVRLQDLHGLQGVRWRYAGPGAERQGLQPSPELRALHEEHSQKALPCASHPVDEHTAGVLLMLPWVQQYFHELLLHWSRMEALKRDMRKFGR